MTISMLQKILQSVLLRGNGVQVEGGSRRSKVCGYLVGWGYSPYTYSAQDTNIKFLHDFLLPPNKINNLSALKFRFDRCASILYKQDLCTYQVNRPFRKVNICTFLIGPKDICVCARSSSKDVDFALSRLVWRTPCKEQRARRLRSLQVFGNQIFPAQLCTQNTM